MIITIYNFLMNNTIIHTGIVLITIEYNKITE